MILFFAEIFFLHFQEIVLSLPLLLQNSIDNVFNGMTKKEIIEHWIKLSDNDLKVAEDLFILKHYLYVGFSVINPLRRFLKDILQN